MRDGGLVAVLRHLNPGRNRGPWKVLCDNEAFLRGNSSMKAYRMRGVELVELLAKSPVLNLVEKMWRWLRKRLRRMGLADLAAKRAVLGRTGIASVVDDRVAASPHKQCLRISSMGLPTSRNGF